MKKRCWQLGKTRALHFLCRYEKITYSCLAMPTISENIAQIKSKTEALSSNVTILAAIKTIPLPQIFEALEAGISMVGESKIQEAKTRVYEIRQKYPSVKIHFIGHLQTNKINQAISMFDVIESVDSFKLAEAIDKRADKPVEIFIEVNTSGEASKFGVDLANAEKLVVRISALLKNLKITGLMTIGSFSDNKDKTSACFKKIKELKYYLNQKGYTGIKHLSMGMSHDFELAIEECADIIRIGTAIFGERNYQGGHVNGKFV